jgi:TusA-related sulfurtransferase
MKADATLDAYGLLCPMPIVKTSVAIRDIDIDQVLLVIASDEGIKEDMPAWCKASGHEFLGIEEQDGEFRVYVKRKK